jgi:hypothetical protein
MLPRLFDSSDAMVAVATSSTVRLVASGKALVVLDDAWKKTQVAAWEMSLSHS